MNDDEIIRNFSSFDDLKKEVSNDLEEFNISSNRFPVRFIFLNSHEELKEIVDLLINGAKKEELSSWLYSDNSWFTSDQIIKNISNLDHTSVIVPLSEFIRFSDDEEFIKIISQLATIENNDNNSKRRLYIPLVGLWKRFENLFWNSFSRKENWTSLWKLDSPSNPIKIYQVNFDFKKNIQKGSFELVSNSKQWFELWKKNNFEEIISLIKPLSFLFKNSLPDNTFTQEIINTPKDYLYKLFHMNVDIPYNPDEKEFWDELLVDVSNLNRKNLSLTDIFIKEVNINEVNDLSLEFFLDKYLNPLTSNYAHWIIKNFFINYNKFEYSYLYHCFNASSKLDNNSLARKIFLEIFNLHSSEKFLKERRELLKIVNKYKLTLPERDFNNYFKNLSEYPLKKQLLYLTNNTNAEKFKIFEIIQQDIKICDIILDLKDIFPELYYYLDWNIQLDNVDPWIIKYFREYTESKVHNNKSKLLIDLLKDKNNPDHFFTWYSKHHLSQTTELNDEIYTIWVDSLGAEWLPLLIHFLNKYGKENNKKVKFKTLHSVNLPSATKFNKKSHKKIEDLDKYIHSSHYNYPESLLNEIEIVKNIASKIASIDCPKIALYSDHGFSFLCTSNFGSTKKYDFSNTEHEGRYFLQDNDEYHNTEDYISVKTQSLEYDNQKYIVALNHTSLCNTPSHEVHGGATPEEVMVPYILFEDDYSDVIYTVEYDGPKEFKSHNDNNLEIMIYPDPLTKPIATQNGNMMEVSKCDKNKYSIHLDNDSKGKQNIVIKVDDEEIYEFEVSIIGGMRDTGLMGAFGGM